MSILSQNHTVLITIALKLIFETETCESSNFFLKIVLVLYALYFYLNFRISFLPNDFYASIEMIMYFLALFC